MTTSTAVTARHSSSDQPPAGSAPSTSSMRRLAPGPPAEYCPTLPPAPTTRWQGITSGSGLAAMADPAWDSGCCPVCGAWAVIGEMRGLERARRLRCGRCGGDWAYPAMRCFACGERDHRLLGALVPEGEGESRRAETCERCAGFVKSIATLRGWAGDEIVLADLASLELDVAAIEAGYGRPSAVPRSPVVSVTAASPE